MRVVVALVSAGAAGFAFLPAVGGPRLSLVVPVSALLAVAVAAGVRRRPLWIVPGTAVGWPVTAALLLWPRDFPGSTATVVTTAARGFGPLSGWVLPAPDLPALLVLPSLLVWVVAVSAARLDGLSAVVPGWSVWGLVVALSFPGSLWHLLTGAFLLAATILAARPVGRVTIAAAGGLLLAVSGSGLALAIDDGTARDVRAALPQEHLEVREDLLGLYDRWRAAPDTALFAVQGGGIVLAPPGLGEARWRLTDLAGLDGDRWVSTAEFRRLPPDPAPPGGRTVTVTGLDSVFLPGTGTGIVPVGGTQVWAAGATAVRRAPDLPASYIVFGARAPASTSEDARRVPAGCAPAAEEATRAFGSAGFTADSDAALSARRRFGARGDHGGTRSVRVRGGAASRPGQARIRRAAGGCVRARGSPRRRTSPDRRRLPRLRPHRSGDWRRRTGMAGGNAARPRLDCDADPGQRRSCRHPSAGRGAATAGGRLEHPTGRRRRPAVVRWPRRRRARRVRAGRRGAAAARHAGARRRLPPQRVSSRAGGLRVDRRRLQARGGRRTEACHRDDSSPPSPTGGGRKPRSD